jgi:hypothetical protein
MKLFKMQYAGLSMLLALAVCFFNFKSNEKPSLISGEPIALAVSNEDMIEEEVAFTGALVRTAVRYARVTYEATKRYTPQLDQVLRDASTYMVQLAQYDATVKKLVHNVKKAKMASLG